MPTLTVAAPIGALPGLVRDAVESVEHATLIDSDAGYALVGVHTTVAFRAETTRFDFSDNGDGTTTVHARSTNLATVGWIGPSPDDVLPSTGRAVFDRLARSAADSTST